jgi:hypothetical protein
MKEVPPTAQEKYAKNLLYRLVPLTGLHCLMTPTIGREYPTLQLSDVMNSPNRDCLIRDLAIVGLFYTPSPCPYFVLDV